MVTPDQAEELAKTAVSQYLTACGMESRDDIANALMKLASVTGIVMACAEGRELAAQRLEGTVAFVRKSGPKYPRAISPVH